MCARRLLFTETVVMNIPSYCFRKKFGGASIASTKGACSTDVGQIVVVAIDLPSNDVSFKL